jgi:hypothetical protein
LEGIHLPSFRFSWKLKKLCLVDFFVFESWQTAEDVMVLLAISPRSATIQKQQNRLDEVSLITKKM